MDRKFLLKSFLFPAVTESEILGKDSGFLQEGNRGTGALRYLKIPQSLLWFALVLSFYDISKIFVSFFSAPAVKCQLKPDLQK